MGSRKRLYATDKAVEKDSQVVLDKSYTQQKEERKGARLSTGNGPIYPILSHRLSSRGGSASTQGYRKEMQDAELFKELSEGTLYGIFDGHGGTSEMNAGLTAAEFVKERFLKYFSLEDSTDRGIANALKESLLLIDEELKDKSFGFSAGTTALIALENRDKLWIANVGDSRAVLIDPDGRARQLTFDARSNEESIRKEIGLRGGKLTDEGRVYALSEKNSLFSLFMVRTLNLGKTLGDHDVATENGKVISAEADIVYIPLDAIPKGSRFVLACDGLFDVASTDEVGRFLNQPTIKKMHAEKQARSLVEGALNAGTKDNVTAIVVIIQ